MTCLRAMFDYSGDSVRSPLKTLVTKTLNPSESVHTFAVDVGDCQNKGSLEATRDKRIAKLKEMFRLVQEATKNIVRSDATRRWRRSFH